MTWWLIATGTAPARFHVGVGDPTPLGWFTTLAYLGCALLCLRAWRRCPPGERRLALFWLLMTALTLSLGLNKQLDLQTWLTQTLRDHALAHGWYTQRQRYQRLGVFTLFAAALSACLALAWWLRPVLMRVRLALLGLALLSAFVVLRAAYFHGVGGGQAMGGDTVHAALELIGISTLGAAAAGARAAVD